ncbi:unnamed protein product [Eruca vesicaria subsp. sativa]|uniref:Glycoside hydrolase family 3 C-terminal domain-containing protein n=1 Tax=Eruca vesicaria subsp. sativa TaxID=29727 RepID=A0ABC8JNW2_ERUVS|nr:unnamed protein product [Eruca vesicaria subsp. sativa]
MVLKSQRALQVKLKVLLFWIGKALIRHHRNRIQATQLLSKLQFRLAFTWSWVLFNFNEFINDLMSLVRSKVIPITRIDDAVSRILLVKFTMGLFENPLADYSFSNELGSQAHRDLAREAVSKSLVLLKNGNNTNPMLPLPRKASKILVAGTHADNLGYQCGGWTITWQGLSGNKNTRETAGDSDKLTMRDPGPAIVTSTCQAIKCVVVVVSGRPLVMAPYVASIEALVAAWLPGTEGQGITDALFGDHGFSGKLPITWFRNAEQLPMSYGDLHYDPLFAYGSGLVTESVASIVARYKSLKHVASFSDTRLRSF